MLLGVCIKIALRMYNTIMKLTNWLCIRNDIKHINKIHNIDVRLKPLYYAVVVDNVDACC